MLRYFIFWCICLTSIGLSAGPNVPDSAGVLKNKVAAYIRNNDIISANRLLNSNNWLEPEYVISTLNHNLLKAESEENQEALAYTYLSIGNFWLMRSNKIEAFESFFKAEKVSRAEGFDRILALTLMNRSHIESEPGEIILLLREAVAMFGKLKDTLNLAKANLNLGKAFSDYYAFAGKADGRMYRDSAFKYYNFAGRLNDSISYPEVEASVNVHFAEWFKHEGDMDNAVVHFNAASYFFGLANQAKGQIYCLIHLGEIHLKRREFKEASYIFAKALKWASELGFTDYVAEIYNHQTALYEQTGDLKKALEYNRLYMKVREQLSEATSQDKIHALNLEYSLAEQNVLIEALNQKKRTQRQLLILVSSAAVLALISSYLLIQNKRRKLQLVAQQMEEARRVNKMQNELMEVDFARQQLEKQLLEEKVKVKTERIIMIANQIKKLDTFLNSINEDLKSLVNNGGIEGLTQKVNDLKLSLSQSMHEQMNLRELQALSTEVNQDFLFRISKKYEGITRDDIKLLSFLVMDMASKEIAVYFNISQDSVNKKRYRLRQKLQMPPGMSFADFYRGMLVEES